MTADLEPRRPPRCPSCGSVDIAKQVKPSVSAYLRCEACGQVWHPDRLLTFRTNRPLRR